MNNILTFSSLNHKHQENVEVLGEKVAFEMFWNKFEISEREAVKNVWEQISSKNLVKDDNIVFESVEEK